MTYFELLKAAKTGIFPPDATYFDRLKVDALKKSMKSRSKPENQTKSEKSQD